MNSLIKQWIEKHNGYLVIHLIKKEIKITPYKLKKYVEVNELIKIKRGLYRNKGAWEDIFYELSVMNPNIIFSHETALWIHNLMEREPSKINISTYQGNKFYLNINNTPIKIHYNNKKIWNLGAEKKQTMYSNEIKVYDLDRTICDLIKNKKNIEAEIYSKAWNYYMESEEKNLFRLAKYAKKLNIFDTIEEYIKISKNY